MYIKIGLWCNGSTRHFGCFRIGSSPISPTIKIVSSLIMKYNYDLDKIKNIVSDSLNFSEVLRKLNIPNKGYNIRTIKRFLIRNNIDFSHFTYEKRINKKK